MSSSGLTYTPPPERLRSQLAAIAATFDQFPEVLPRLLADPARHRHDPAPFGPIAARLADLPEAAVPRANSDGESESLGPITATHRFVDAPGDSELVRWHLVECGPQDAEVLVLLHGVPDSWWQWHHVMEALGSTYRCVAIDLKGYGQSDKRTGDYRQEGVARQLLALVDQIGIGQFSIVAHDRGTPPADHLVALARARVRRYGRGEQHLWHFHPSLAPQEKTFTSALAPIALSDARTFVLVAYTTLASLPVADADLARTIAEFSHDGIALGVPRYFNSSSFRQEWIDRRTRLIGAWRCPVLLLQARADPFQPHEFYSDPEVLARLPGGSEVHLFECGHFWPFEAPAATAGVLAEFMAR
ncbi:MAG TPA: alpha/beta hydrolase [Solirubrobacteraceae bacterium]|nr:alpha/beta hydrolase [Solirubrobacteraceae bacterium]